MVKECHLRILGINAGGQKMSGEIKETAEYFREVSLTSVLYLNHNYSCLRLLVTFPAITYKFDSVSHGK